MGMNRRSDSAGKLCFDIQRLTLPGYTEAEQQRFTVALNLALGKLWPHQVLQPQALCAGVGHVDGGSLREGATPEDAAQHVAAQLIARVGGTAGGKDRG
jgi:hypothetical protein